MLCKGLLIVVDGCLGLPGLPLFRILGCLSLRLLVSGAPPQNTFVFDGPWVLQTPPGVAIGQGCATQHMVYIDAARLGGGSIMGHPEASIVVPASSNTWIVTVDDGIRYKMVMIEVTFFMDQAFVCAKAAGFARKKGPMTGARIRSAWQSRKPQVVSSQDGRPGYGVVWLAGRIEGVSLYPSAAVQICPPVLNNNRNVTSSVRGRLPPCSTALISILCKRNRPYPPSHTTCSPPCLHHECHLRCKCGS